MLFWAVLCGTVFSAALFVLFGRLDAENGYDSVFNFPCEIAGFGVIVGTVTIFILVWDIVFFILFLLFLAGIWYTLVSAVDYLIYKIGGS